MSHAAFVWRRAYEAAASGFGYFSRTEKGWREGTAVEAGEAAEVGQVIARKLLDIILKDYPPIYGSGLALGSGNAKVRGSGRASIKNSLISKVVELLTEVQSGTLSTAGLVTKMQEVIPELEQEGFKEYLSKIDAKKSNDFITKHDLELEIFNAPKDFGVFIDYLAQFNSGYLARTLTPGGFHKLLVAMAKETAKMVGIDDYQKLCPALYAIENG